jgi:hypothetical protein
MWNEMILRVPCIRLSAVLAAPMIFVHRSLPSVFSQNHDSEKVQRFRTYALTQAKTTMLRVSSAEASLPVWSC